MGNDEQRFMHEIMEEQMWKSLEIYQVVRASKCLTSVQLQDLRIFLGLSGSDTGETK